MNKNRRIIILEGADSCGKSTLSKYLQAASNGKCHVLHGNYNNFLPGENHRKQHKNIAKFVANQFDLKKCYSGNHLVILDRCYVSDITYGQIGYGSRGTWNDKFKYLDKLFKILSKDKNIIIQFIYCRPSESAFDKNAKEELLSDDENTKMQCIYDKVVLSDDMKNIFKKYNVEFYIYDFKADPQYLLLNTELGLEI